MLEAVLQGREIQVLPSDDVAAFEKVFSEFMQTDEYYKASPMIQDYISVILTDVTMNGATDEEHAAVMAVKTIHPRVQKPKQNAPGGTIPGLAPQLQNVAEPAPSMGLDPMGAASPPPTGPLIVPSMQ